MNTVWRITDKKKHTILFMEKKPHVRKYMLENKHHDRIQVEEVKWNYKHELVRMLNDSFDRGFLQGHEARDWLP